MTSSNLAVIPARGGSKGVPLKNIKFLNGRPLIEYAIETAKKSKLIDKIIVSTDHDEIAKVSERAGAEVILRPAELARDESRTEDALIHVLDVLFAKEKYVPDIVLTLEPTSPFRTVELIDRTIEAFTKHKDIDSAIGVIETRSCFGQIVNDRYQYLFPNQPRRRQERKPLYEEASTIYATKTEVLRKKRSVLGDHLYPIIVADGEAVDINNASDFEYAEFIMKRRMG